ncbi:4999_t:CDS:2, partial [Gigaspora margarita]
LLIFIKALVFNDDSNFPEILYKAKDAMSFNKTIIQFVVCQKCQFLTNVKNISNNLQPGFEELLEFCYERENTSSAIFSNPMIEILIPGPKEPPTEKINLYLDLLVNKIKQL